MLWWLLTACVVPYVGAGTDTAARDSDVDTVADTPDAPPDTPADPVDTPADPVDTPADTPAVDTPVDTPAGGGFNLTPWDRCADAVAEAPLGPGEYRGTFAGLSSSGLAAVCLNEATAGADAFFRVTLQNAQTLNVRFAPAAGDGQVYLLADCNNQATCIAGADDYRNQEESVSLSNTSGSPQTWYLVIGLRGQNDPKGPFDLSITVQ